MCSAQHKHPLTDLYPPRLPPDDGRFLRNPANDSPAAFEKASRIFCSTQFGISSLATRRTKRCICKGTSAPLCVMLPKSFKPAIVTSSPDSGQKYLYASYILGFLATFKCHSKKYKGSRGRTSPR